MNSPRRIRLTVAYDGHPFEGWQSQPRGNTVQDHLERAVAETVGRSIAVHGAGRTDAGVHALAQVAHFDSGDARLTPAQWVAALNSRLPREIRVLRATRVATGFHARFSAIGKTYVYRIRNGPVLPPHELFRVWHVPWPLDVGRLRAASTLLVGRRDFAPFAANCGRAKENTVRTLQRIAVRQRGESVSLSFCADGFLYRMVRLLTGALVHFAAGRMDDAEFRTLVDGRGGRCKHCAPADGLWLVRVQYPGAGTQREQKR